MRIATNNNEMYYQAVSRRVLVSSSWHDALADLLFVGSVCARSITPSINNGPQIHNLKVGENKMSTAATIRMESSCYHKVGAPTTVCDRDTAFIVVPIVSCLHQHEGRGKCDSAVTTTVARVW